MKRCSWCEDHPLNQAYHDTQWGIPVHHDRLLFEFLILEGAQAGLSWITILKKRENYQKALDNFDFEKIAQYGDGEIQGLLANPGIVRNRLKIQSTVKNARATLEVIKEYGSLDSYLWQFVNGQPIQNAWTSLEEIPTRTAQSDKMSRELKKRGFSFVGSTICYAFMQAVGMVNDHTVDCFRYRELSK